MVRRWTREYAGNRLTVNGNSANFYSFREFHPIRLFLFATNDLSCPTFDRKGVP